MKILITAFEPFGNYEKNASLETVRALKVPENVELIRRTVPVVFGKAEKLVNEAVDSEDPDAVICLGQAGGRRGISLERTAANLRDAKNPDNEGNLPVLQPVVPGGRATLLTTLPIEQMLEQLKAAGIEAEISGSAGNFVCNSLMYGMLYHLKKRGKKIPAGFIHVPCFREQAEGKKKAVPFMELDDIIKGIEICVRAVCASQF